MFSENRTDSGERRIKICQFIFIIIMIIFSFRLFYLQIIKGDELNKQSENNRISEQRVKSPRGLILDNEGKELAVNRGSINVYITIEKTKNLRSTLNNLSSITKIDINFFIKKLKKKNRYRPILLLRDINQKTLAKIAEHRLALPGVTIDSDFIREYPDGHFYAHLIGYLREINKTKLKNYKIGDYIGFQGIEKSHEKFLRGDIGIERIEVDAHGRKKRIITPFKQKSGNNIHLTINLRLQKKISELFSKYEGSVIALDPMKGAVLSIISHPNYDPNIFKGRVIPKDWKMVNDNPLKPLLNRSLKSVYPPGSIFKAIMAFAFLSHPDFEKENEFFCNGSIYMGKKDKPKKCWKKEGHGKMGLKDAVAQSCDVYFYKAGRKMGFDHIRKYANQFGVGKKTGFSKKEKSGLLPSEEWKKEEWKKRRKGYTRWYLGDTYNLSIGQGFLETTPIQVASLTSSIANGGKIYRPYVVEKITSTDGKQIFRQKSLLRKRIQDKNQYLEKVRLFLKETVNSEKGTGKKAKSNLFTISGKTGTAQAAKLVKSSINTDSEERRRDNRDHSWFIAFAPYKKPEIALVIFAEHTDLPGSHFAPMAKEIIEFYIQGKKGIRIDK